MNELELVEQFKPGPATSVAEVLARAAALPDRKEIEQDQAEREAAAARAERDEVRLMLNASRGDPLGQLSRCQAMVATCRDEVADLESQLQAARGRLHRAAESLVDIQGEADEILSVSAQRSHTPDPLADARRQLTDYQLREMAAVRSQARPPFTHGGSVARSDQPVTCRECLAVGATWEQSFLIHQDPDAPFEDELLDVSEAATAAYVRDRQAERRTPMIYAGAVR